MFKYCELRAKGPGICAFGGRYEIDDNYRHDVSICGLVKGELFEIRISNLTACPLIKLQAKKNKRNK